MFWLGRQVSKTLGQVLSIVGVKTLIDIVESGISATTEKEWRILDPRNERFAMPRLEARKLKHCCPF